MRSVVGVVAVVVLALVFIRWAGEVRQSGVRAQVHGMLRSVAQAAELYQQDFSTAPTFDAMVAAKLVDPAHLKEFSRGDPVTGSGPGTPAREVWLVQTKPCRAVKKGEAWGGPGETIDHDLPACRFVLKSDWTVVQMDEAEYQRDLAPRVKLTPVR